MPYSSKTPVSMIVHRIGQSILIDDMDLHRLTGFLNATSGVGPLKGNIFSDETEEWSWLKNFFYEIMLTSYESKEKALVRRDTTRNAIQERNLISKFLHRSLEGKQETSPLRIKQSPSGNSLLSLSMPIETDRKDNATSEKDSPNVSSDISGETSFINDTSIQLPPLPEPSSDDLNLFKGSRGIPATSESNITSKDFARTLLWNFEDIRMLIGSDMPIFGDKDHPSVSLRLHNAKKPIHILTGLDYWLDNLMCQVPEVLMCFHLDGIVQKYELYKTEDLPALSEGGNFSPGVIRDVAQNILSFLKVNAAKEGHTYWLFKGKDDDIVKLYDLTDLCEEYGGTSEHRSQCQKGSCESSSSRGIDGSQNTRDGNNSPPSRKNPFRTTVSLLLYKVARNILNNTDNRTGDEASAKRLLSNCLQLLDAQKYPQIATSAHFMLSDLYVPDDIDPANPKEKFSSNESAANSDDLLFEKLRSKLESSADNQNPTSSLTIQPPSIDLKSITNTTRRSNRKLSGIRKHSKQQDNRACKEEPLENEDHGNLKTSFVFPDDDMVFSAPPITTSVVDRCRSALIHAAEGLISLKNLEKKQHEHKVQEDKAREQYERDNPKMSRPNEAIPMPYSDMNLNTRITKARSRCQSESALASSYAKKSNSSNMSWHDHLKTVLFKKATIIYVVLAETHFVSHNYGQALRSVKRSLNCYEMVCLLCHQPFFSIYNSISKCGAKCSVGSDDNDSPFGALGTNVLSFMSFALGLAGDSYYNMLQNWGKTVEYQEGFNAANETFDETITDIIEGHVEEAKRDWAIKVPKDIEEAMHLASRCYDHAVLLCEGQNRYKEMKNMDIMALHIPTHLMTKECKSLIKRRGNLRNEMGVFYVNQADALVKSGKLEFKGIIPEVVCGILKLSKTFLNLGLEDFTATADIPNQALVMSNSGRHCRLYAYCFSLVETDDTATEIRMFRNEHERYKKAIELYENALKILTSSDANAVGFGKGKKNQYSKIYESVSWDLQTTCFIWGSRLQDSTPKEAYSMEEVEKMIVELYGKALRFCEIDLPGPSQPIFQYRAASIHMKLGSLYHLKYRTESESIVMRDSRSNKEDHRRKNLKQLAENHYSKAVAMFKDLEHGQEFLRVQTERVYLHESDLSKDKGSTQSFNNFFKKTYNHIFELLCDTLPVLQLIYDAEKLPATSNPNKCIDSDDNKNKLAMQPRDEEEIHIYDVLVKKIQNNLLDISKSLSVKQQQIKMSGKASDFLATTKKLYLKSIVLKSSSNSFLSDLIALLKILKNDFLPRLK